MTIYSFKLLLCVLRGKRNQSSFHLISYLLARLFEVKVPPISPAALVPSIDSVPLVSLFQLLRLRSKSTLSINTKLLCSQFESLVEPFVKRTVEPCKKVLSDAGAKANTINDVILDHLSFVSNAEKRRQ
ncbi:hypothetical protein K435DRAFT_864724 [Dendrothele bispora CBS 962.96]|uniref:Uncharacterized protein n=1 Tax=Dendrothele bispora (strain CBS 962.96) TaxID=1314807 RepID=A0A4S8LL77_DENBC|nr:hypothetical protein K435DRAFT_864724 [Dendrothele bispora CBS 962.96]